MVFQIRHLISEPITPSKRNGVKGAKQATMSQDIAVIDR